MEFSPQRKHESKSNTPLRKTVILRSETGRRLNGQRCGGDRQANNMQNHDEGRDAVDGPSPVIQCLLFPGLPPAKQLDGHAANPRPVQHDVDEDTEGKNTEQAELNVAPMGVGESPKRPAGRDRAGWKNHLNHDRHPQQCDENKQQRAIQRKVDVRSSDR